MSNIVTRILEKTLLAPVKVCYSSQTIYQVLIGCLRIFDATQQDIWKERADKLCRILLQIQRPDGGFDIGYEFNFGKWHKRGEPTSPELFGLIALVEYYKRNGGADVQSAAQKAAEWIRVHAIEITDRGWAIPYAPFSTNDIMVYNGTSFAAGALGIYLSEFPDSDLEKIYHGMNLYLLSAMSSLPGHPGKVWYYFDQSNKDLREDQKNKIDYYHQMQQVEVHGLAESYLNSPGQKEMIRLAADHVAALQERMGLIPYLNSEDFQGHIHVWGFCSCASGFLVASSFYPEKGPEFKERASRILSWIFEHAWNGHYIIPILEPNGQPVDSRYYVRSDAWAFNAFALGMSMDIRRAEYLNLCEKMYLKMEGIDFSGIENHASSFRLRMGKDIVRGAASVKNILWPR